MVGIIGNQMANAIIPFPGGRAEAEKDIADVRNIESTFPRSLIPFGPALFRPPFDVITELTHNLHKYRGDREHKITTYGIPASVEGTIERIASRVLSPNAISPMHALICCASNGIQTLQKDPYIQEVINIRKSFNRFDNQSGVEYDEILSWFNAFRVNLPEISSKSQSSICVPEWLKGSITGLSKQLGVSAWTLLTFSAMLTLITQPGKVILDDHRKVMKESIDRFFLRIRLRRKIGRALLEIIDPRDDDDDNGTERTKEDGINQLSLDLPRSSDTK
jgi:hypothetical protein